jgi:CO/xanthine dehydrogenase Mo-binding subunit
MDRALADADYHAKRERYALENARHPYLRKGVGLATFFHGAGFTGSGETFLASEAWVEGLADGRVEVLVANTEMGQGAITVLTQIAADALGVGLQDVLVAQPDTARVPDSGPTVASRTVMVVGRLVELACADLARQALADGGARPVAEAIRAWHRAHPGQRLLGRAKYQAPSSIRWDDKEYRGDAYPAYAWAAYVADVEVDLRTYQTRVRDFVARQEVGRVIHPGLAAGQIQGGVAQAIGWALMEDVILEQGAMRNNRLTDYIIPACADLPPIRVFFEENPCPYGPQGAKGIGELPMDGGAPAVINAVCAALGTSVSAIPLTPERLMDVLEGGAT